MYFAYPPGGGGQWLVFVPDAAGQVTITPDYPIRPECLPNNCSPMPQVSGIVFRRCDITDAQLNDGAMRNWEQSNCDAGGYCPPGMTRRPR